MDTHISKRFVYLTEANSVEPLTIKILLQILELTPSNSPGNHVDYLRLPCGISMICRALFFNKFCQSYAKDGKSISLTMIIDLISFFFSLVYIIQLLIP